MKLRNETTSPTQADTDIAGLILHKISSLNEDPGKCMCRGNHTLEYSTFCSTQNNLEPTTSSENSNISNNLQLANELCINVT